MIAGSENSIASGKNVSENTMGSVWSILPKCFESLWSMVADVYIEVLE